ncbi:hypothetical protein B0G84_3240 [Paraburkholderia sp. BL8N3]|nr:hypothetical protein [Paraburkholderia sp. BL8N3]TCK37942.1 hypothetical protein B0G84_3240 [Paraburkholderia sp. BL8N3]
MKKLYKSSLRATYDVFYLPGFICVVDLDEGRSVTNDIENVIADLAAQLSDRVRLIDRDTQGIWDEVEFLTVNGCARFRGFRSLHQRSMQEAIAKASALHAEALQWRPDDVLDDGPRTQT